MQLILKTQIIKMWNVCTLYLTGYKWVVSLSHWAFCGIYSCFCSI